MLIKDLAIGTRCLRYRRSSCALAYQDFSLPLRTNGTIRTWTLTFIKVEGLFLVRQILESGAGEDFPPLCPRVLLREDDAQVFHCCPNPAFAGSLAGFTENSLALKDGDNLRLRFSFSLAMLVTERTTGHRDAA